jgi:hypothetical protein
MEAVVASQPEAELAIFAPGSISVPPLLVE